MQCSNIALAQLMLGSLMQQLDALRQLPPAYIPVQHKRQTTMQPMAWGPETRIALDQALAQLRVAMGLFESEPPGMPGEDMFE